MQSQLWQGAAALVAPCCMSPLRHAVRLWALLQAADKMAQLRSLRGMLHKQAYKIASQGI